MMKYNTFILALRMVHDALYGLSRPAAQEEFLIMKNLINGYIALLGNLDETWCHEINKFLLAHSVFDEDRALLLYTYLVDPEQVKH